MLILVALAFVQSCLALPQVGGETQVQCLKGRCPSQYDNCFESTRCAKFALCLSTACGSTACAGKCFTAVERPGPGAGTDPEALSLASCGGQAGCWSSTDVEEVSSSQTCKYDADCAPTSWCMNDPTKTPPYTCHGGTDVVKHYTIDKNHCGELYVPQAEFDTWWASDGNWKFPTATAGKCQPPYTTIDSTTADKAHPEISYVKRGIAASNVSPAEAATCDWASQDLACTGDQTCTSWATSNCAATQGVGGYCKSNGFCHFSGNAPAVLAVHAVAGEHCY